jgi:hypothetical protein
LFRFQVLKPKKSKPHSSFALECGAQEVNL